MPNFRWLVACCCVAVLANAIAQGTATTDKAVHLENMDCGDCHLAGADVSTRQASKLLASQEALCGGSCHGQSIQLSHPSGFPPKSRLPAEYPLDWKGDLTCSTCHLVHGRERGLLRGNKRGKDLCLACHDTSFFLNMKDQGTSIVQSGHLGAGITLREVELDPFSLQCLDCHSRNFDVPEVDVDRFGILRHASGLNNHPVGRRYRDSTRFGGYHPEQALSEKIVLPDGKISCVSCHQAYNLNHGELVLPNARSSLCLECHDL